jgi:siroheme synthase-like protein
MTPPPIHGLTVTVLGSGTCVPALQRSSCALLISSQREQLVLDFGPGTMRRLVESGVSIAEISAVGLSHFHPDHSGELGPFLFASKYAPGQGRRRPLTLMGGPGFALFFKALRSLYGRWIDLEPQIALSEIDPDASGALPLGDVTIATCRVAHNPESIAYRITAANGASVVYSGDTDTCERLVALATGADLLICEAALPNEQKAPGHLTPALAGDIARRAGVGRLLLTHFYPECETVDLTAQCRQTWQGPLMLAHDLMQIPVGCQLRTRQTGPAEGLPGAASNQAPGRCYYPINLDMRNRHCLVVGGGAVGSRKAQTLVDCGARVTVVSPDISPKLGEMVDRQTVTLHRRGYRRSDLDGTWLVFAAASDPAVNRKVHADAREEGILCNLAELPDDGDFILPSIVRRGDLVLGISTSGASPALAKQLREQLEAQIGPEVALLLQLLRSIRTYLLESGHDPDGHRRVLNRLVRGPLPDLLRNQDMAALDALLARELGAGVGYATFMTSIPDD